MAFEALCVWNLVFARQYIWHQRYDIWAVNHCFATNSIFCFAITFSAKLSLISKTKQLFCCDVKLIYLRSKSNGIEISDVLPVFHVFHLCFVRTPMLSAVTDNDGFLTSVMSIETLVDSICTSNLIYMSLIFCFVYQIYRFITFDEIIGVFVVQPNSPNLSTVVSSNRIPMIVKSKISSRSTNWKNCRHSIRTDGSLFSSPETWRRTAWNLSMLSVLIWWPLEAIQAKPTSWTPIVRIWAPIWPSVVKWSTTRFDVHFMVGSLTVMASALKYRTVS